MTEEEKKEKNRIAVRKYYQKIKDKKLKLAKEKRANNLEEYKNKDKDYYLNNREKIKARKLESYYNNRDKNLENMRKYRETYIKPFTGNIGTGTYNITLAERYKEEWLSEKLTLYHLKFKDEDGTVFYKYGLTKNLNNRLYYIPYTPEIISTEELSKYDAIYKERELLKDIISYNPIINFGGHKECFILKTNNN